jgi:bla regulator protein blaR1
MFRLMGGPPVGLRGQKVSMSQLASTIANSPGMASIIEDGTGLTELFDISTTGWNATDDTSVPGYRENLPVLTTVLQEQLGLTLKKEKKTVNILVIDHVERPSPN